MCLNWLFPCSKVQQRISYPVWVLFLFYPARELSYMASSYHCNFLMHFQMKLNRSHNSFRITFQHWKWISGLPLAIAASFHWGNNLPEPMRKQHTESAASSTRRTILGESAFVFEASGQSGKMDGIKCSSNKAKTFQKKSWVAVQRCTPWCGGSKCKGLVMEG